MRSGSARVRHLSGFGSFHFITNCSMKSYKLSDLTRDEVDELKARPQIDFTSIFNVVRPIVDDVRSTGDKAVKEPTLQSAKVELDKIVERINDLPDPMIDPAVQKAFDVAYNNIYAFHAAKKPTVKIVENMEGVRRKTVARSISAAGLYVTVGTAMLLSTALMLSVPAQIAGCKTIVLATPPPQDGSISKEVLYRAKAGIARILEARGAQAILAAPWGTESCPKGVRCKKEAESISTMDFSVPVGMELLLSTAMAGLHSTFIELVPVGMKLLLPTAMAGLLSTFIEHVNAFSVERKIENRREPRLLVLPCPWDSLWDFLSGGRKEKKARILLFEIVPRPSLGPLVHTIQPFPFICPHCTEYLYKWPVDHIRNCNGGEAGSNFEAVWESVYHRINMDPVDCRICPICKRRLQMEDNNVQIHIAECQERRRRVGTTAALPGQNFCGAVRKFFSGGYTSQSTSSSFS